MTRDEARKARAARRRQTWRGWISRDGGHRPAERMTPDEALGVMNALAREGWELSGRPWPDYDRSEMPGRVVRRRG